MDKNSTEMRLSEPSSNVKKRLPSSTTVLAAVSFLSETPGTLLSELNPRSRCVMFMPTKTLSSNFIKELWLRSSRSRCVKTPNVPSLSLEIPLCDKIMSTNFGEVSNK